MSEQSPLCRDCCDLQREVLATHMIGRTPVCEEHKRKRLGERLFGPQKSNVETTPEKRSMAKRWKTDQKTIDAIRADAAAGMNFQQIAEKHGVSWPTAKRWSQSNGMPPRKGNAKTMRNRVSKGSFDVNGMLSTLRSHREALDDAIAALEKLEA
jgi:hypothetical protein